MSALHWPYRDGAIWMPFFADGFVTTGGCVTTLSVPNDFRPVARQPIGFAGAAPGASLDPRGLPRVRVKAGRAPR